MSAPLPPLGARLMIILAPGAPTRPSDVLALLEKGDVAALIWRGPADPETVEAVQQRDVAVILDGAPHQVAAAGLDGVHVSGLEGQAHPGLPGLA